MKLLQPENLREIPRAAIGVLLGLAEIAMHEVQAILNPWPLDIDEFNQFIEQTGKEYDL